ncbi:hypothetical protein BDW59DRAFT_153975 [Aspergillus cavernicola]|uniref:Zn(2)-C6 fungal-type domain-containing protein n=1 Tax=Aspergillus cavernicola TaxID=176166 RepID=A0ABR4HI88_9EURO
MQARKHTRNQNACDVCRNRRVKCRYTQGEFCDGCQSLGVPCTSNRPRRRRGPPNRHAAQDATSEIPTYPVQASPAQSIQGTSPFLSIESPLYSPGLYGTLSLLGSDTLIHSVLDDWFEHIHPLAPIIHRRRFLSRLRAGDANNDPVFCGLVISVLCATCATLRRKSFTEYHPLITLERGVGVIQTYNLLPVEGPYSLDWCVAKYNLTTASMAQRDMTDPWIYRTFNEAIMGTRYLLSFKLGEMTGMDGELLKRLNCLLVISMINLDMLGDPILGRLAFDSNQTHLPNPLTDLDLDLDLDLSHNPNPEIPPCHGESISYVPGLTHLLTIFLSWHTCQTDRFYMPAEKVLANGLLRIQTSLDDLPPELRWRGGLSRPQNATPGHDVQIANIFVTSLYVRSNLLQQFGTSSSVQNQKEHRSIVSDLLEVLYHLPQPILEANGYSLIPKIRDIGAAYLEVLQIGEEGGVRVAIEDEAKGKLERLLRKLGVLDFRPALAEDT